MVLVEVTVGEGVGLRVLVAVKTGRGVSVAVGLERGGSRVTTFRTAA